MPVPWSPGLTALLVYVVLATGIFPLNDVGLLYLVMRAYGRTPGIVKIREHDTDGVTDENLPTITILLPLYKERKTLPYLMRSLSSSTYPFEKLDIRFLVEHDDIETLRAVLALASPERGAVEFDRFGVPRRIRTPSGLEAAIDIVYSGLRTKPNALNVGLQNARGKILTIFDAEDRPDPNELRKVAAYMAEHPQVACVQARLGYYNPGQSILTRYFSIEYIQHFLVILPELFSMENVIPLGGTSNFFRIEALRDAQGWDPANVTEDADLGVRLARLGYKVAPVNVITWEEAPPRLYDWVRQRVRWNKGFLYTLAQHFRYPRRMVKDLGARSSFYLLLLLAYPLISAVSVFGWALFVVYWVGWLGFPIQPVWGWIQQAFTINPWIFYVAVATFTFGVFYSTFIALEGLFRQGDEYSLRLVKFSLFTPVYMFLHGIASTVAIFELLIKPRVWHKTTHGFSIAETKPV